MKIKHKKNKLLSLSALLVMFSAFVGINMTAHSVNAADTYSDGSPIDYTCPNGSTPRSNRNGDCYEELISSPLKTLDSSYVGKACDPGQGTPVKDHPGQYREVNGSIYCYGYKKVNKVAIPENENPQFNEATCIKQGGQWKGNDPAVKAQPIGPGITPIAKCYNPTAPGSAITEDTFCDDQFGGQTAELTACKSGKNGSLVCTSLPKGSSERNACMLGSVVKLCGAATAAGSTQGTVTLNCYVDAAKCIEDHVGDAKAIADCQAKVKGINKSAVAQVASQQGSKTCGGVATNLISCDEGKGVPALAGILKIALFVLTILVGIAAVASIVYAAILYASGEDNSSRVGDAKNMIRNTIIGLFLYGFMVVIINWLVPGGVIGT